MSVCPRDRLLAIVNDIELISKEMFEYFLAPKHLKQNFVDGNQLAELLVKKDQELKAALKSAEEQELIQSKIDELKKEVQDHDDELQKLQQSFKEAENILATAIYQAKQKLNLIKQAEAHPIHIDELIKYAHKISVDHSVASPFNWDIGDLRRPYPTDVEMKTGLLAKSDDADLTSLVQQQQQNQYAQSQQMQQQESIMRPSSTTSASSSPYWSNQPYGDARPNSMNPMNSGNYGDSIVKHDKGDPDEVEVMSTDSSTSSSSDSQ